MVVQGKVGGIIGPIPRRAEVGGSQEDHAALRAGHSLMYPGQCACQEGWRQILSLKRGHLVEDQYSQLACGEGGSDGQGLFSAMRAHDQQPFQVYAATVQIIAIQCPAQVYPGGLVARTLGLGYHPGCQCYLARGGWPQEFGDLRSGDAAGPQRLVQLPEPGGDMGDQHGCSGPLIAVDGPGAEAALQAGDDRFHFAMFASAHAVPVNRTNVLFTIILHALTPVKCWLALS